MKLYLAGPLFTAAEQLFNEDLAARLRAHGYECFLPQEQEQRDATAHKIFKGDVEGINWADVVVANMDGADPDSGTCWECGYGFAKDKPVVLYRTDIREEKEPFGPYNLMMHQGAAVVLNMPWKSVSEVASRLHAALTYMELGK